MLAASERRLDRYDELVAAAYQGALWGHYNPKKLPKLGDVLARRRKRRGQLTLEQDIARWQTFFGRVKGKAN